MDNIKTRSGAVFINQVDADRWEELEAKILMDDGVFQTFSTGQWKWLQDRVPSLINQARKQL